MKFVCPLEPKPWWCHRECEIFHPDDPQKQYVYCFEDSLADHLHDRPVLFLSDCRNLVESVCTEYGVPTPEVKDGRGLKCARGGFNPDGKLRIKLPRSFRYRIAVLHETAHCVFQYLTQEETDHQHHDRFYLRYLLDIYSKYLPVPLDKLENVARQF